MLDQASFKWLGGERVWMCVSLQHLRIELVVAGDEERPEPHRLAFAEAVLEDVPRLAKVATSYLDSFVDRSRFSPGSEWELQGLEFGRDDREAMDEFVAIFSLQEDIYGFWSVRLRLDDRSGIVGMQFSRRQF